MDETMNYYKKFKRSDPKMDAYYEGIKKLNAQQKELEMSIEEKEAQKVRNYLKQNQ